MVIIVFLFRAETFLDLKMPDQVSWKFQYQFILYTISLVPLLWNYYPLSLNGFFEPLCIAVNVNINYRAWHNFSRNTKFFKLRIKSMYIFSCLFMLFFLKYLGEFFKTFIISAGSLTKFCVKIWRKGYYYVKCIISPLSVWTRFA